MELSTNKDLAKLAGLTPLEQDQEKDKDDNRDAPSPRVASQAANRPSMALRQDKAPGSAFTPLITPLSSYTSAAAIQPFALPAFSSPTQSIPFAQALPRRNGPEVGAGPRAHSLPFHLPTPQTWRHRE